MGKSRNRRRNKRNKGGNKGSVKYTSNNNHHFHNQMDYDIHQPIERYPKNSKKKTRIDLDDPNLFAIIPFKAMKRKQIPFRFENEWWRRSDINDNYIVGIRIRFNEDRIEFRAKKNIKNINLENPYIAVFKDLLTEKELSATIKNVLAHTRSSE